MAVPSVRFAKTLKALVAGLVRAPVTVDVESGGLVLRAQTGGKLVVLTFRVEMHGDEYELIYRIAPWLTSYSSAKQAKDVAHALTGGAQLVESAVPDIEAFLASWKKPY